MATSVYEIRKLNERQRLMKSDFHVHVHHLSLGSNQLAESKHVINRILK